MTVKRPGPQIEPTTASLDDGTLYRQPGQSPGVAGLQRESEALNPRRILQVLPVMFTERQCGRFFAKVFAPELADFSDYKVELTLIFTDGKDNSWPDVSPTAKGVMTGAFLIPKSRIAAGGALIDLKACAGDASVGPIGTTIIAWTIHQRKVTLEDLRWEVLTVVAHEMFHMIQAWRAGNTYDGNELTEPGIVRDTETFKRIMDQVASETAAWGRHPIELQAQALAQGRLKHRQEWIKSGAWDECLPMDALKRYVR